MGATSFVSVPDTLTDAHTHADSQRDVGAVGNNTHLLINCNTRCNAADADRRALREAQASVRRADAGAISRRDAARLALIERLEAAEAAVLDYLSYDVRTLAGYWRLPWMNRTFAACPFPDDCLGVQEDAPDDEAVSVADLQAAVAATLPRIIAVNWEPEGGKNQLDATVTNVLARLKNTGSASALKRSSAKVSPAAVATAVLRGGAKVPATDGVRTANVGKKDASTVEKYEVEAEEEAGLQFSSGGSEVATTVTSH